MFGKLVHEAVTLVQTGWVETSISHMNGITAQAVCPMLNANNVLARPHLGVAEPLKNPLVLIGALH